MNGPRRGSRKTRIPVTQNAATFVCASSRKNSGLGKNRHLNNKHIRRRCKACCAVQASVHDVTRVVRNIGARTRTGSTKNIEFSQGPCKGSIITVVVQAREAAKWRARNRKTGGTMLKQLGDSVQIQGELSWSVEDMENEICLLTAQAQTAKPWRGRGGSSNVQEEGTIGMGRAIGRRKALSRKKCWVQPGVEPERKFGF